MAIASPVGTTLAALALRYGKVMRRTTMAFAPRLFTKAGPQLWLASAGERWDWLPFMLRQLAPYAADLWQQRTLLRQFTLRNVELRHKGSHLGLVWSFLNPLLMLGLYVFVFGHVFGGRFGVLPDETRVDYALGIFLGLTIFHFASEVLGLSPGLIVANANFVKKVVFPLEVLPAAQVAAAAFHFLIGLGFVLLSVQFVGNGLPWGVLWLPVILLPVLLLGLGIGWLFSALGVFFRDVGQVMQFLTMALLFSSAVFYSAEKIPEAAWAWLRFNPMLLAIELARDTVLWQRPLNLVHLLYLYATGLAVCHGGHYAFRRLKSGFADVL